MTKQNGLSDHRSILLVEDDRVLADLIVLSLEGMGFEVRVTNRPAEVFPLIEELHPNLVLLDLFLPGCNGLDLLNQMKVTGRLEELRVIVITAYGYMEVLQQAILMGAKDFIVKPFNSDLLVKKVVRWTIRRKGKFEN